GADISPQGLVTLTWTNPTGSTVNGDIVRRSGAGSCPAGASDGTVIGDASLRTSQTDTPTGLLVGSSYCYSVVVTDGSGDYSAPDSVTVAASSVPPATNLNADTSTPGQVTLTWTNPTGDNVNGDVVRRGAAGSCPTSATDGTAIGPATLRSAQTDT